MGTGVMPDTDDVLCMVGCATLDDAILKASRMFIEEQELEETGDGEGALCLVFTNAMSISMNDATKPRYPRYEVIEDGPCVGDRIVCTKNLYHEKTKELLVTNGTTGVVKDENIIKYDNTYKDKKGKETVRRPTGFRSTFVIARAMTVHKAQGNEFNYVGIIVVGGWSNPPIELIYTAMSRFKEKVYVYGRTKDLDDIFKKGVFKPLVDSVTIQELSAVHAASMKRQKAIAMSQAEKKKRMIAHIDAIKEKTKRLKME